MALAACEFKSGRGARIADATSVKPPARRKNAASPKRFRDRDETPLKQTPATSGTPPDVWQGLGAAAQAIKQEEMIVSTSALSRNPSRAIPGRNAVLALASLIWRRIRRRMQAGKDRRMLQTLPNSLLSDIGLERIEFRSSDGRRDVWVIPHRYY